MQFLSFSIKFVTGFLSKDTINKSKNITVVSWIDVQAVVVFP